jgi:glutathione synthase/RimK-type ligase-like ATP-grasp enzyme
MNPIIVADTPACWPFEIPGIEMITARDYLTNPRFSTIPRLRVFNLCRSHRYQGLGYYVSLLADARGQRALPSIETIQDMKSAAIVRGASEELADTIQKSLRPLSSDRFRLSIYFGRNLAKRYDPLCRQLYNLFPSPAIRAEFAKANDRWVLQNICPIPPTEVPPQHRLFMLEQALRFFNGREPRQPRRIPPRYSLALLVDPEEAHPPSDEMALRSFTRAAESAGLAVTTITREDSGRLAEYDALFIRATTAVNHFTYRLARRAKSLNMAVIDDPDSIIRCSNKVFLDELLKAHAVPTPKSFILHRGNLDEALSSLRFPIILKQPDSSFSQGVLKADTELEYCEMAEALLQKSDLIIAQEYIYTDFDWRIGILEGAPLYACKYFMARQHWQVYNHQTTGEASSGDSTTVPITDVPESVLATALQAAALIGDGLYGVDIKEVGDRAVVIEVNDNPNIDSGIEDAFLGDQLYHALAACFIRRLEKSRSEVKL